MGFVKVRVKIGNPEKPGISREVELIADTGAIYTVVSRKILEELGIQKRGKRKFKLANGKIVEREVGIIEIEVKGTVAYTTVVFGDENDTQVLGVTALEELGMQVDPTTGELKPMELLLLGVHKTVIESQAF